ncbi:MAG: AAA family ATPase [Isosphaerales bacterium]
MAAWQAATRATGPHGRALGGVQSWPQFVVRWLFGMGAERHGPDPSSSPVARFQNICMSREAGSGAGALARLVGQRLRWKVYDDELIEAIAHRMVLPIDDVKALDEQAPSMVQDWLLPLREEYYAPQEAYLDHLAKLIEAIGRAGESILVGRGAGFMLPRETTLSVRIIAPLKVRAQRMAERMGVSLRTARRAARDLDRRRAQFDRTMHRVSSNDPHNFDMVLDTESLGLEIAGEIIVHAVAVGRPEGTAGGPGQRGRPDSATTRPEPSLPTAGLLTVVSEPVALPAPAPPKAARHDLPGGPVLAGEEPPSPPGAG